MHNILCKYTKYSMHMTYATGVQVHAEVFPVQQQNPAKSHVSTAQ